MSADTHGQNGHNSPTGWAGAWGPLADGRSRLGRLAAEIEAEILEELLGRRVRRGQRHRVRAKLPRLLARDVIQVARLRALASKTVASVGLEPKASPRAAAGVQARADTLLEHVRGRWAAHRRPSRPTRSGGAGAADDLARVARAELAAQARGATR